jgi:cell wall-associated NlpC family hydrolase
MNNNSTIDLADSANASSNFDADSSVQTNIDNGTQPTARAGQRLVAFVHKFVSSLRYTTYKPGGEVFDITHGVYEVDCSHYVNHILQDVFPRAYSSLEVSTGAQTPNSANYYNFFSHLSSNLKLDWNRVDDAKDLQPGDILVFRYRRSSGAVDGGHVMLVMDNPTMDNGALLVQVSDSAFAGHGDDTRRGSGVGIGTLKLKINPYTGQPSAYAWEQDAPWQSRVNIAMGRPEDVG